MQPSHSKRVLVLDDRWNTKSIGEQASYVQGLESAALRFMGALERIEAAARERQGDDTSGWISAAWVQGVTATALMKERADG